MAGFKNVRPGSGAQGVAGNLDPLRPGPRWARPGHRRGRVSRRGGGGQRHPAHPAPRFCLAAHDVPGPGTFAGRRLKAIDSFGRLFMSELWQVFDPLGSDRAGAAEPGESSAIRWLTWALHPDVLDPQFLLSHVQQVRHGVGPRSPRLNRVERGVRTRSSGSWTGSLDMPRAGTRVCIPTARPPSSFLPGPSSDQRISERDRTLCSSRCCPIDDPGRPHRLEHWIDEIKDLCRQFGPCDPRWIEVRLARAADRDRHTFINPPDHPTEIGDVAEVVLVGDWATALPQAINVSNAISAISRSPPRWSVM